MLNLFYAEPDSDRWLPYDRYPRRIFRRLLRGPPKARGHQKVFLNLVAGLRRLGVEFRVNDYRYLRNRQSELACIIGTTMVLEKNVWRNPILFGAGVYSHPIDAPGLLDAYPIEKILVPGAWMKDMCKPFWGTAVEAWPVGIDTSHWLPSPDRLKTIDVLLYDKIRWDREEHELALLSPVRLHLRKAGVSFIEIRYGKYSEQQFHAALRSCRSMIFLVEHETQGIAYQEALSCGVPILAWDRGGEWRDPAFYPERVRFSPVTSVPYWDERCGRKFRTAAEFAVEWPAFWNSVSSGTFHPRDYILQNLTLEKAAQAYLDIAQAVMKGRST